MVAATSDYLKPISFLVVDDRAYMRRVIKGILETLGCKRIDEAHHGGEAMSIMRSWAPDIVITEWLLAPMSGLELLKAVRADKSNIKFTPLIMITSETRREKVILARNAGVTEYVAKPFNAKSLILRIREIIERPRPFVDVGIYFGPDRRRRAEVMSEGEEKRGKGGPRPVGPKEDPKEGLTQEQIDKLVAGDAIRDR
jgi:two-component system chemotaxis response regulator CheY